MVRTAFSLIGLVLCTLFGPATTRAQEISPRSYLFVEVADPRGEVVVDATVRLSNADGKELVNLKTGKNGVVQTIFARSLPFHHYDLQITKTGYVPYESVLLLSVLTEQYFAVIRLTDEISNPFAPSNYSTNYSNGPPVKITLRETPATPAEAKKQQLIFAAKRGDAASLRKLLQEGVDVNSADPKGVPAVDWATFAGDPETIKLLLDAGANVRKRESLLIYLAEGVFRGRLQTEIIQKLLAAGADVNASSPNWGTVLNKAISQLPLGLTIETIRALIKAGADVNAADANGQTPLMLAAQPNQTELVDTLLSAGAKSSLNAKDKSGRSALGYAAAFTQDSALTVVKILIANGAVVTEADDYGETPLIEATFGAGFNTVKTLLEAGASVNAANKNGKTALFYAVESRKIEMVRLLLQSGADVNIKDKEGQTPIALARKLGEAGIVKLIEESRH